MVRLPVSVSRPGAGLAVLAALVAGVAVLLAPAVPWPDAALRSDPARRYETLRSALAAGDFRAANTEFSEIVLALANRTNEGWLGRDDPQALPCADLVYIDTLFSAASGGRFGFAAQDAVLKGLAWPAAGAEQAAVPLSADGGRLVAFGTAVGWYRDGRWLTYENLDFSPRTAPPGHLPVFMPERRVRAPFKWRDGSPETGGAVFDVLDERFAACQP